MSETRPQPLSGPESLLPEGRETFRVWEVAKILSHSMDQVERLVDAGAFGPVLNCAVGKKRSLTIPRSGLLKFLNERKQ